jgi:preprotein translocase subunit SecB
MPNTPQSREDGPSTPELSDEARMAVLQVARRCRLAGIETVRIHGERLAGGASPSTEYRLEENYALLPEDDRVAFRLDVVADLRGDDETVTVAQVEVSIVVLYDIDGVSDEDRAALELFGASNVTVSAYPFLREAVAATALRLGFPGVNLPLLFNSAFGDAGLAQDGQFADQHS